MKYGAVAVLQNMLSLQRLKALPVAAVAPQYRACFGCGCLVVRARSLSVFEFGGHDAIPLDACQGKTWMEAA
jgi:hypothetical protein